MARHAREKVAILLCSVAFRMRERIGQEGVCVERVVERVRVWRDWSARHPPSTRFVCSCRGTGYESRVSGSGCGVWGFVSRVSRFPGFWDSCFVLRDSRFSAPGLACMRGRKVPRGGFARRRPPPCCDRRTSRPEARPEHRNRDGSGVRDVAKQVIAAVQIIDRGVV